MIGALRVNFLFTLWKHFESSLWKMTTPGKFTMFFTRAKTFVTFSLLSNCIPTPFWKGVFFKVKNSLPKALNSFLFDGKQHSFDRIAMLFLCLLENRLWHYMQIVFLIGEFAWYIKSRFLLKNKEKISSSAEFAQRIVKLSPFLHDVPCLLAGF